MYIDGCFKLEDNIFFFLVNRKERRYNKDINKLKEV